MKHPDTAPSSRTVLALLLYDLAFWSFPFFASALAFAATYKVLVVYLHRIQCTHTNIIIWNIVLYIFEKNSLLDLSYKDEDYH